MVKQEIVTEGVSVPQEIIEQSKGTKFWKYFYVRGSFKSVRLKQQYRLLN